MKRLLKYFDQINEVHWAANVASNLAVQYNNKKDLKTALAYNQKALDYHKKAGNEHLQGVIYGNIGGAYINHKYFEKSIPPLEKSLRLIDPQIDGVVLSGSELNLGLAHLMLNHFELAKEYLDRSLKRSRDLGAMEQERKCTGRS